MPALCIFWLQNDELLINKNSGNYLPIIATLWGMHIIAFLTKLRIYKLVPFDKKNDDDDEF